MERTPRATIDFETRSQCSIKNCGGWRYSIDPTTNILCLAYRLPHWEPRRTGLWHPAFPHIGLEEGDDFNDLADLFAWIEEGRFVEAHNVAFERAIWGNLLPHWPQIGVGQWMDSAAKAAAHALPRALDDALVALKLDVRKDAEGEKVMKKMAQPRKPTQADKHAWYARHVPCHVCAGTGKVQHWNKDGSPAAKLQKCPWCVGTGHSGSTKGAPSIPVLYHETLEQFQALFAYCRQDVLAEEALSEALPDLNEQEQRVFVLDATVNDRGFQLDQEAVTAALALVGGEVEAMNEELAVLTGGVVQRASQRAQMMTWLATEGLYLDNTQADTLDYFLDADESELPRHISLTSNARRGIELMRAVGRSSTAKYGKMRDWMAPDGRIRGGLLYHGATTGRWAGKGIQPHNFPKGSQREELKGISQDTLWDWLKTRDAALIEGATGGVMESLSHGLRGTIVAGEGKVLYVADYSSIEARVLMWLADDYDAIGIFERGEDIYCSMAADIYHRPITKADFEERQLGKATVLGCGYQMGASKFVDTASTYGVTITEEFSKEVVTAYREKFWRVKQMWQHLEDAAIAAAETWEPQVTNHTMWFTKDNFLYCELPSGRRLAYPFPEVHETITPWGEPRDQLTFMGIDTYTRQWKRLSTYGGMLTENVTQAVARDIMAEALLRCERHGVYAPVLTVHDEIIAEADAGTGAIHEFERLLTATPLWGQGCPIAAEGWTGGRYHK